MHLEIRRRGKRKLYYLAHSFRENERVRKIRRYLGSDLTGKEISELRERAERAILGQIEIYRAIKDPLHTVLSTREMEAIKTLIARGEIKIKHLSEEG